mmetsp:Transcript_10865/g.26629  ORF Transcript_10865/g.26629 Transcript_10865/m.26629 type:complete len:463 (-) Transcript_10865:243-1631(-)|eukprot:CAMPEP_0114496696 /NCGR_PEP_ID=MMETSP0109-20121206/5911_1 /TAXON_ID=29199 /ORGANISM="Chlorarachnion reptans, Strain CCCM449" /LENGTH=462 /DNA_ID=CAMNT_0001673993 /DNA_START=50 /DNA_END=1438 /DNA_ORIENTATION=+
MTDEESEGVRRDKGEKRGKKRKKKTKKTKKKKKSREKDDRKRRRRTAIEERSELATDPNDEYVSLYRSLSWSLRHKGLADVKRFAAGHSVDGIHLPISLDKERRASFLVKARDERGLSLLDHACRIGYLDACKWLVEEQRADPRTSTEAESLYEFAGWRPLHHAVALKQALVAEWLTNSTEAKADANVPIKSSQEHTKMEGSEGSSSAGHLMTPMEMGLKALLLEAARIHKEEENRKIERIRNEWVAFEAKRRDATQHSFEEKLEMAAAADWSDYYRSARAADDEDQYRDHMTQDEWSEFIASQHRSSSRRQNEEPKSEDTTNSKREHVEDKSNDPPPFAWNRTRLGTNIGPQEETARKDPMEVFTEVEEQFQAIMEKGELTEDGIPFPTKNPEYFEGLRRILQQPDVNGKKVMRTLLLKWHPDKFMSRFGERVPEASRQIVEKKVTEVVQLLNKVKAEFSL